PGLATVHRDGTHFKRLTRRGDNPDWSPDGSMIVFGWNGIRVADLHPHVQLLTRMGGDPSWSPDGSHIVYSRVNDLWIMDSNGDHRHLLVKNGQQPDWSRR